MVHIPAGDRLQKPASDKFRSGGVVQSWGRWVLADSGACLHHQHFERWARQAKLHKLYLRVYAHNPRGRALYTSCGYTEEGRLMMIVSKFVKDMPDH